MGGPTMSDVARHAGVSAITVSRAFKRDRSVDAGTRARVFAAAESLKYVPSQRRSRPRSKGLAILGGDEFSIYQAQLLQALSKELISSGQSYEILPTTDLSAVTEKDYAGVIVTSLKNMRGDFGLDHLRERLPVVTINSPEGPWCSVGTDYERAYESVVELLASKGHRRVAVVLGESHKESTRRCLRGYRRQARDQKMDDDDSLIETTRLSPDTITRPIAKVVRAEPTALIVAGEMMGAAALEALKLLGKHVPEDLSLVSYEIPHVSPYLFPPLTTIKQNYDQLAAMGMQLVVQPPKGESTRVKVQCDIIIRDSVADPAYAP